MQRLATKIVDKPWGKRGIDARFNVARDRQVGEIWFEPPAGRQLDVMAKYLFTTERLSIQVHPDDPTARARGYPRGKDECWIVLDVADDAELGIGTVRDLPAGEVLDAARDGSIVDLIDWRRPEKGDFIYNPAGTIHALGPGLTVLEIQQAVDLTYRLYDYGRPRELHLEQGIAVAKGVPHDPHLRRHVPAGDVSLVDGPYFRLDQVEGLPRGDQAARYHGCLLVIPRTGKACVENEPVLPGQCALAHTLDDVVFDPRGSCLIAQPCAEMRT